jgi:hypothetical protein
MNSVARIGFRFGRDSHKGRQENQQDEDPQRDDDILEDAVRPEELPLVDFTLILFFDLLF